MTNRVTIIRFSSAATVKLAIARIRLLERVADGRRIVRLVGQPRVEAEGTQRRIEWEAEVE